MDRRNFFMAALATIAGWFFAPKAKAELPAPKMPGHFAVGSSGSYLVVNNPADSRKLMYLSTGDFIRPGEWFAVPFCSVEWLEYDVPNVVCA